MGEEMFPQNRAFVKRVAGQRYTVHNKENGSFFILDVKLGSYPRHLRTNIDFYGFSSVEKAVSLTLDRVFAKAKPVREVVLLQQKKRRRTTKQRRTIIIRAPLGPDGPPFPRHGNAKSLRALHRLESSAQRPESCSNSGASTSIGPFIYSERSGDAGLSASSPSWFPRVVTRHTRARPFLVRTPPASIPLREREGARIFRPRFGGETRTAPDPRVASRGLSVKRNFCSSFSVEN
ncbi:hypothetical protein GWI33_016173 [Rhynchophorus ferrugineus]|uniref:Uncharacterized protein n=1 Tax=Rhynchophorus ferrugineus TaxID=354439 RepID=A0A834MAK8_RHYFE|nr:hypothetical protein GWI33_016173 [Rhynchophorus ferrugineus]